MTDQLPEKSRPDFRASVHRPPAVKSWSYEYRWGPQGGDTTTIWVHRKAGGSLKIGYGKENLEIRKELIEVLAAMLSEAAGWVDES